MQDVASGIRRLVMAASDARTFTDLRLPLIAEILRRRHKVLCLAPEFKPETRSLLEHNGASYAAVPMEAKGFNPFASYGVKRDLVGHLKIYAPHALALCDAASMPLMMAVAKKAGVPRLVPMLPRLPLDADATTAHDKAVRAAMSEASAIVVETPEERRALAAADWMTASVPVFVAPSAGIHADRDLMRPLPPIDGGFVFLLVSRPDDAKALEMFSAAANFFKARSTPAVFRAAADDAHLSDAIAGAHVVVHLSAADGLNRGLIAGLAAGRPLITTDVGGSRDTVDERVNGCRVAPGDAEALVAAMQSFLKRMDLVPAMARASRLKAERRYDVREVNRITLDALGLGDGFAVAA